jgi:hypothetical protein
MAVSYVPLPLLAEVDDFGAAASSTAIPQLARLSPGTLYPMLHSMEMKGYLRSREKKSGRSVRRLCLVAVFVPSFLLVIGGLPIWEDLRRKAWAQSALRGVNAAVVGLLLAALYHPVWTAGIKAPQDFAIGVAAILLLFMWNVTPWLVVVLCAAAAAGLSALPNLIP